MMMKAISNNNNIIVTFAQINYSCQKKTVKVSYLAKNKNEIEITWKIFTREKNAQ